MAGTASLIPPFGTHYSLYCMLLPLHSFFAYEPILKALQSMRSIPLAQHLLQQLPSSAADSAATGSPSSAMQSMQAALARPLDPIELPAYLESAARPPRAAWIYAVSWTRPRWTACRPSRGTGESVDGAVCDGCVRQPDQQGKIQGKAVRRRRPSSLGNINCNCISHRLHRVAPTGVATTSHRLGTKHYGFPDTILRLLQSMEQARYNTPSDLERLCHDLLSATTLDRWGISKPPRTLIRMRGAGAAAQS